LIKSLPENKKYGAKQLLKCFLTKTGVLVDWKCWWKNWQHRNDVLGSGQARIVRTVPVMSIFLISAFSPSSLQVLF